MEEQVKNTIKGLIKKLIPEQKIIDAILKAKGLKQQGVDSAGRFQVAVDAVIAKFPFPVNVGLGIVKHVLIEAVQEAVQETFDDLRAKGII